MNTITIQLNDKQYRSLRELLDYAQADLQSDFRHASDEESEAEAKELLDQHEEVTQALTSTKRETKRTDSMKTLHMTDKQYRVLEVLLDRGIEDLQAYLAETKDPRMDGYSDEEVAEMRRLESVDVVVLKKTIAGLQPPPGYAIRCDGLFGEPYYAIEDDEFGAIVSSTYERREHAVEVAWSRLEERIHRQADPVPPSGWATEKCDDGTWSLYDPTGSLHADCFDTEAQAIVAAYQDDFMFKED